MASSSGRFEILFRVGSFSGLSDDALIQQFVAGSPERAEAAFTVLVERYETMIRRVCRQITRNVHDAEDAAQATFLVLARSARSLRNTRSLAAWLLGVALRVSARANADAVRRQIRERRAAERTAATTAHRPEPWHEVHEELARLPERYRLPIMLCHLEGLTYAEAADRLRCPVRTVQTRLARGRERLRSALVRRGLGPSFGALIPVIPAEPASAVWVRAVVHLAMSWKPTFVPTGVGTVPAAAALAREVLRTMLIRKLIIAAGVALIAATSVAGTYAWTAPRPQAAAPIAVQAQEQPTLPKVIKGRVVGPDGRPLAGATVATPFVYIHGGPVKTDLEGRFTLTFKKTLPESVSIQVAPAEFPTVIFIVRAFEIGRIPGEGPHKAIGEETNQLEYLLEPSGEINHALEIPRGCVVTGRIIRDGKPVSDAIVELGRDPKNRRPRGATFSVSRRVRVQTNAEGRFRFPLLHADSAYLISIPTGSLEHEGVFSPRTVRTSQPGSSLDLGDMEVMPGRTLSGRVIVTNDKPLPPKVVVVAMVENVGGMARGLIDQEGRFTLTGLPDRLTDTYLRIHEGSIEAKTQLKPLKDYRLSPKNQSLKPFSPERLIGKIAGDMENITILLDPDEQPRPSRTQQLWSIWSELMKKPIRGVPSAIGK